MYTASFPRFAELPRPPGDECPLAWQVFGPDDQVGMLNNIDEATAAAAALSIRQGRRFNLNLPLDMPLGMLGPGAHARRRAPCHTIFHSKSPYLVFCDDKLDDYYLQGSTQWDGLTHVGDAQHGFYNGASLAQVTEGLQRRNGVDNYCRFGIAARGLLVDLPRFYAARGQPWKSVEGFRCSADDLMQCLRHQDSQLCKGDILLVRTGWVDDFRTAHSVELRDRLFRQRDYSGLTGDLAMWEFLWDHRVAAVAADSVTVEVFPLVLGKPSLHMAIARMGLILGEMFDLDALAEACAAESRYDCFVVSSPLNLKGGVGTPANAMAIL